MTDLETIRAMFAARGIELKDVTNDLLFAPRDLQPSGGVALQHYGGYAFFYTLFVFSADGSLRSVEAYE